MSLSTIGRNVNIDRIDSCSEVTLGVGCTCCISLIIASIVMPFIQVGGIAWVKSWEGAHVPILDYWSVVQEQYSCKDAFHHLDANGDGMADSAEFEEHASSLGYDEREAKAIELEIDPEEKGISEAVYTAKCEDSVNEDFKEKALEHGDAELNFKEFDNNNDGKIDDDEFNQGAGDLGFDAAKAKAIKKKIDTNGDGFLSQDEFYTFLGGSLEASTSAPTTGEMVEQPLTAEELEAYVGAKATVSGKFFFYLALPIEPPPPPAAEIQEALKPIITHVLSTVFEATVETEDPQVVDEPEDAYADAALKQHRMIISNFELDSNDGGSMQKDLQQNPGTMATALESAIHAEKITWIPEGTRLPYYSKITVNYYGSHDLPKGAELQQRTGTKHGDGGDFTEFDGSFPYVTGPESASS